PCSPPRRPDPAVPAHRTTARLTEPRPATTTGDPVPHHVTGFEFSEDALAVRAFIFDFWCEHGRGPNLREVHEALDLDRKRIKAAYKQLQLGIVITVDEDTQNCNLLKAPPFSSFPSQVSA